MLSWLRLPGMGFLFLQVLIVSRTFRRSFRVSGSCGSSATPFCINPRYTFSFWCTAGRAQPVQREADQPAIPLVATMLFCRTDMRNCSFLRGGMARHIPPSASCKKNGDSQQFVLIANENGRASCRERETITRGAA